MNKKQYYRVKEASVYSGIPVSTLWWYCKLGKLTPRRPSSRVTLFDVDDLNNLINNALNSKNNG
ncbi:MAG: helix-turn-helix domain-containing protein [Sulfuricurvum sp.]